MYDRRWPIWTYQQQLAPAKFVDADGKRGTASDSLVSGACIVSGATVTRSVLFSGVHVRSGASLDQVVALPDVDIGPGCRLTRVVIDRRCELAAGHGDRRGPRGRRAALSPHRKRRRAGHAGNAGRL
jgi:glucose-1-phosphate adenylyltransferase